MREKNGQTWEEQNITNSKHCWSINAVATMAQEKGPELLEKWLNPTKAGVRKLPGDLGTSWCARRCSGVIWKDHRSWIEGLPTGQIWDNLNIKKNNVGNGLQYIIKNPGVHNHSWKYKGERGSFLHRRIPANKCRRNDKIRKPICNHQYTI